jgi:hypothetical protein
VDKSDAERFRALDLALVLPLVATHAKRDGTFVPLKDQRSQRWHATAQGDYELVLTGSKFWDTRARTGGGGAVDLTMHIWRCSYRLALRRLCELHL